MTTSGKLSKSERARARRKLLRPAITFANPADAQLFVVGMVYDADLSDPEVCKFLYGACWEHVLVPKGSPEKVFSAVVRAVDPERGVVVMGAVK